MSSPTTTGQARKARTKPERRIGWLARPTPDNPLGVITIHVGHNATEYTLRRLACDYGEAYELAKFVTQGGEVYHVNLDRQHGRHTCDCKGFLRWNHCKHVEGLAALIAAGRL
jgi:hypothetical protein